ncbi:MAG: DUF1802 family protein [Coleofasciculaceae cyanobacterium]
MMSQQVSLPTALRLSAPDIEALIKGRTITAMPGIFVNPGRQFALYPSDISTNILPIEQYYRPSFLPTAQQSLAQLNSETVTIKAWAKCQLCQIIDEAEGFDILSQLTVWTEEALQQTLKQRGNIFLAYLRVYRLPQPLEMPVHPSPRFVPLPQSLKVTQTTPALSNTLFAQRFGQMQKRQPPLHPGLEELQSQIAQLADTNLAAKELDQDIKVFLGWSNSQPAKQINPNLLWINTISALGNRSKEQDTGKSNYQAGTDFENIVRDSLEFLGFTIDYAHKGGAGGLDLFCSQPYPLVGECKAGKKIPNDTAVQLLNLGTLRLRNEIILKQTTKLIIGPGEPTQQLADAAKVHGMAIINPETLEKLVKLQSQYRNSIDLYKLKNYLKSGQADDEVEKYIEQVSQAVKVRSHIVNVVKKHLEKTGDENSTVKDLHVAYIYSNPPQSLQLEELRDILIELSSPLTGYLGRSKGRDGSDRFYFLRDLD